MENMENMENIQNGCQCDKEGKCKEVAHCVYKAAKLVLKAATVCAIFHVAKEVHKVHKAIKHEHKHLI